MFVLKGEKDKRQIKRDKGERESDRKKTDVKKERGKRQRDRMRKIEIKRKKEME